MSAKRQWKKNAACSNRTPVFSEPTCSNMTSAMLLSIYNHYRHLRFTELFTFASLKSAWLWGACHRLSAEMTSSGLKQAVEWQQDLGSVKGQQEFKRDLKTDVWAANSFPWWGNLLPKSDQTFSKLQARVFPFTQTLFTSCRGAGKYPTEASPIEGFSGSADTFCSLWINSLFLYCLIHREMKEMLLTMGKPPYGQGKTDQLPSRAVFPSKVPPQPEPSVKAVPEPREISQHMVPVAWIA